MDTKTNTLRGIRIAVACAFLAGITLLFMGIGADWWGWMAKVQFLPAVLRAIGSATFLNLAVVAGIIALTLIFGRIYCSVVCPLGIFQDFIIWLRRRYGLAVNKLIVRRNSAKVRGEQVQASDKGRQHLRENPVLKASVKHFEFSPERKLTRYGFLILSVAAMIAGLQVFIALIAPYSAYGKIVRGIAGISDGSPLPLVITGLALLLIITACALLGGRIWCNTICPVGTFLGLFSRFSLFRISIDEDKCTECGRCVRGCKASCIDGVNHTIDYSRCVDCFDCIGRCSGDAISYGVRRKKSGTGVKTEATDSDKSMSRRKFLGIGAVLAGAALADSTVAKAADQGGFAPVTPKQTPERDGRIVPPGAKSVENFYDRCTSCQLCVAACPNNVLRPSTDLQHFLQPEAGYEKGFCRPECVRCSEVCPAGAILPVTVEEKSQIHIGLAKVNLDQCIDCGNCAHHCPTGAIRMIKIDGYDRPKPVVMEEVCIGCGACEYLCPVRPISAITIDGLQTHRI